MNTRYTVIIQTLIGWSIGGRRAEENAKNENVNYMKMIPLVKKFCEKRRLFR